MPFLIEKYSVLYCGHHRPIYVCYIENFLIALVDRISDLGVVQAMDIDYTNNCIVTAVKAIKAACAFKCKDPKLMWPAHNHYVLPAFMCVSQM